MNNSEPTRKDNIIDLTIASTVLSSKIEKWKVQHEVYLNSDHRLISFEFGEETSIEVLERFDFKNTDWDKYEKECSEAVEEWLEGRRYGGKIDDDYDSFLQVLHRLVVSNIPKKKVCKHSKGWWTTKLTELSKSFRKAKHAFSKRKDQSNEAKLEEIRNMFKEEVFKARDEYLDEVVKLMDPKKPGEFWKVVNRAKSNNSKGVIQPIVKEDGSLAVSDEEIFTEMKKRYGKESLDVKAHDEDWFNSVEQEIKDVSTVEEAAIKDNSYLQDCGHENSDITIQEVEAAILQTPSNSAPSPEEKIFSVCIRKGGEVIVKAIHYLINKSWSLGVLPQAFKLDPK